MPNLKDLKARIGSVNNTRQITKAMKMVAAAKLRRSQEQAFASRPYSENMGSMVQSIASGMGEDTEGAPPLLAGRGDNSTIELVVFTADRGLCGSFNSGIVRDVRTKVAELEAKGKQVSITCIGRKGYDVLKRQYADNIRDVHTNVIRDLSFQKVEDDIARKLVNDYNNGVFDLCYIVFNQFQSAMTQILTWKQIIPVPIAKQQETAGPSGSYIYEPSEDEILDNLLPKNVAVQLFQALVESDASEHGSRMTAMDNAVRNAGEMINKLTITYNRTRQAAITTELMEIIGGAESLKG